jgi:hypothetical protein
MNESAHQRAVTLHRSIQFEKTIKWRFAQCGLIGPLSI